MRLVNKSLKIILITLAVIVLVIALIAFGMIAFVYWVFIGARFTPKAAMEGMSLGSSDWERIEIDGSYFYLDTEDGKEDWICGVVPVEKTEIGLWAAHPRYPKRTITIPGSDKFAGYIISVEGKDCWYNFYIPPISGYDPESIPEFVTDGYDSVTAEGREIEVYKHCYFITKEKIKEFEINGVKLVVGN